MFSKEVDIKDPGDLAVFRSAINMNSECPFEIRCVTPREIHQILTDTDAKTREDLQRLLKIADDLSVKFREEACLETVSNGRMLIHIMTQAILGKKYADWFERHFMLPKKLPEETVIFSDNRMYRTTTGIQIMNYLFNLGEIRRELEELLKDPDLTP